MKTAAADPALLEVVRTVRLAGAKTRDLSLSAWKRALREGLIRLEGGGRDAVVTDLGALLLPANLR